VRTEDGWAQQHARMFGPPPASAIENPKRLAEFLLGCLQDLAESIKAHSDSEGTIWGPLLKNVDSLTSDLDVKKQRCLFEAEMLMHQLLPSRPKHSRARTSAVSLVRDQRMLFAQGLDQFWPLRHHLPPETVEAFVVYCSSVPGLTRIIKLKGGR